MITTHRKNLEQRCRERGYKLADVMPCVMKQDGDQWAIDTTHPAYPNPRTQISHASKLPITDAELEFRKTTCLKCTRLRGQKQGVAYCAKHTHKKEGKICVSASVKLYRTGIMEPEPWCEPWRKFRP